MPETIIRKNKSKVDTTPSPLLKPVTKVITKPLPVVTNVVDQKLSNDVLTKSSVISASKVKKILDTNNLEVMEVISTIKRFIEEGNEVKKGLSDKQLDVVGKYINKHKNKLEGTESPPSTNEVSLRAFLDQKFKFKKDLTVYLAIICDLILEEIMGASMEHVLSIDKKRINNTHILDSQLSNKLLYPLYCKLPSFLEQTTLNAKRSSVAVVSETNEETSLEESDDVVEDVVELSESATKLNKCFIGNIKSIFNDIKGENINRLNVQKKYQEFLSILIVEFIERVSKLLLITLKNNSTSKFIVKGTGITVIESLMTDYNFTNSRYMELVELIESRN